VAFVLVPTDYLGIYTTSRNLHRIIYHYVLRLQIHGCVRQPRADDKTRSRTEEGEETQALARGKGQDQDGERLCGNGSGKQRCSTS